MEGGHLALWMLTMCVERWVEWQISGSGTQNTISVKEDEPCVLQVGLRGKAWELPARAFRRRAHLGAHLTRGLSAQRRSAQLRRY
jgi:hypothetical protein